MIVSVPSGHMGLFERHALVFIYRQHPDIHFLERFADPEDPESHLTHAIPIAARLTVGIPHTTTSTRPEVDAYRGTYNGQSRR